MAGGAIRRALETSPFPILLVCLVGIVLLSVFAPAIVVGDTWLTLMAGREVVENGLPHTEHLTVLGEGRTWTDQQWLAQVVFYAAHGLAGMRAVILLGIAFVLLALGLAFATARTGGASSRSTFVDRLPRDPRRPVGLDASRADGRAPALRRRRSGSSSTRAPWSPSPHAARPAAPRPLGEPARLRRPRRRPRRAARARRAGSRTTPRVDPAGARRPLPPLRPRDAVRVGHRRVLQADARRRAVRADPPRVAVVEPERDDRALLAARARRRGRPRPPALQVTPDLLRARRPRGDLRSARCRLSAA